MWPRRAWHMFEQFERLQTWSCGHVWSTVETEKRIRSKYEEILKNICYNNRKKAEHCFELSYKKKGNWVERHIVLQRAQQKEKNEGIDVKREGYERIKERHQFVTTVANRSWQPAEQLVTMKRFVLWLTAVKFCRMSVDNVKDMNFPEKSLKDENQSVRVAWFRPSLAISHEIIWITEIKTF